MTKLNLSRDVAALNPGLARGAKLAQLDTGGYRSELERRVAREYIPLQEPSSWLYEPCSLKLGCDVSYTPDFLLMWDLGMLALRPLMIEAKGYTKSLRADQIRFKLAVERFPCFRWLWLTWDGDWVETWWPK